MVLVTDLTAGRPLRCHVGLVLLRRRETIMPVRCVARPQFWKRTRRASLRRRAVRRNQVMWRKRPRRCETPGWVGWWCPAGDRGRPWRPIPGMRADRLTPEGEACLPTSYSGEEWTGPCFHAEEAGWRWRGQQPCLRIPPKKCLLKKEPSCALKNPQNVCTIQELLTKTHS